MYYNRTLSPDFSKLISPEGSLRWLFNFIKAREDLDFLIGKNKSKESLSVYRGTTKILTIKMHRKETIVLEARQVYKDMVNSLYGIKRIDTNFQADLKLLLEKIIEKKQGNSYYDNKKEGYYQNSFSRMHGIIGSDDSDFIIVDKEVVVGYENQS